MREQNVFTISEGYDFVSAEEGVTIALFAILKELKTLNKTLKSKDKE